MPPRSSKHADVTKVMFYMFFPGGGIGRYTHEVANALHARPEIEVELACLEKFEFLDDAQYNTWPNLFPIDSPQPFFRRARFLTAQVISPRRALKRATKMDTDVLHLSNINHLTFPIWNRLRKRNPKLKLAATAHDIRRANKMINKKWEDSCLQSFYRSADALFIHSPQQRQDLLDFAAVDDARIHEVPMGTMPYAEPTTTQAELRKRFDIPENQRVGLFFGNIRDDKNLDGLLRAMQQLKEPIFLVIAGRAGGIGNHSEKYYQQLVEELGLEDNVRFLNRFIEDSEIGDLFTLSDFVPVCYRTTFTSQSAVLNVAMHYEKPVIATPAPTLAATVKQYEVGTNAKSDSPADIREAIEDLAIGLDQGKQFEFAAYKNKNSWQENARITSEVYRDLLQ